MPVSPAVVVHADEACLGNGMQPPTPGGAGGLVETHAGGRLERRDYFLSEPDTTNNRMALRSAIAMLELVGGRADRSAIEFVSDSNYVVQGMKAWVPAWRARGWRRKGGEIENLDLWQRLVSLAEGRDIRWRWVRGHAGHVKNEYANYLATRAAREQRESGGLTASGFLDWLALERERGRYLDHDPDATGESA